MSDAKRNIIHRYPGWVASMLCYLAIGEAFAFAVPGPRLRAWRALLMMVPILPIVGCQLLSPLDLSPDPKPTLQPTGQPPTTANQTPRMTTPPIIQVPTSTPTAVPATTTSQTIAPPSAPSATLASIMTPSPTSTPRSAPTPIPTPHAVSADHPCANGIAVPHGPEYRGLFRDCVALLEIQEAIAGQSSLPWTTDIAVRRWLGVELGGSPPRVHALELNDLDLSGHISPSIGQLDGLVFLKLAYNRLTGPIPPEIGNLANLTQLHLQHNRLTGPIPSQMGNLAEIRDLLIQVNLLTGQLPTDLGKLRNLRVLDVGQNRLTGPIPDEIGSLPNLSALMLGTNYFAGTFPPSVANNPSLERLDIGANRLAGCIPVELRQIDANIAPNVYCGDEPSVITQFPPLRGGPDLGIIYIERLPRYLGYRVVYAGQHGPCPYPFETDLGPALCPHLEGEQFWPEPGDAVDLVAHIQNFGDAPSTPFRYRWDLDGIAIAQGTHAGLAAGERDQLRTQISWPEPHHDPVLILHLDPSNSIAEVIEENNLVTDWITGYPLGFSFTPFAYTNIREPQQPGPLNYSPEYWLHRHVARLNELLAEAGLRDRMRIDTVVVSEDHGIQHRIPYRDRLDGWWSLLTDRPKFHRDATEHPDIDYGLLHELLHQMGVIDLYIMYGGVHLTEVQDANRPGKLAGCGKDYWHGEETCFRFPDDIADIMGAGPQHIGRHTAGGLASNFGHRRGYYGEYLFDTPSRTLLKVVDDNAQALKNVEVRFYQFEVEARGQFTDAVPEFAVTTADDGTAVLPNRGITGLVTETGHQLRPNPFGMISVVGLNGIFLLEMEGECINYQWLSVVDLNLAFWSGQTEEAVIEKVLKCPPP